MRGNIEKLFRAINDGEITKYRISKECGLPFSTFTPYMSGKSKVDNMSLSIAEKLSDYYLKEFGNGEKE